MQRSCADVNSPYKRKYWTDSGFPLVNSLVLWDPHTFILVGRIWIQESLKCCPKKKWRTGCNFCNCHRLPTVTVQKPSWRSKNKHDSFFLLQKIGKFGSWIGLDLTSNFCDWITFFVFIQLYLYRYRFSSRFAADESLSCWPFTENGGIVEPRKWRAHTLVGIRLIYSSKIIGAF